MNFFVQKRSNYRYSLQSVSSTFVEGWFYSKKSDKPVFIDIRLGTDTGPVVASGLADLPRGEFDGKCCGFKLKVKDNLLDSFPANLIVCVKGLKVINFHVLPQEKDNDLEKRVESRLEYLLAIYSSKVENQVKALESRVDELESSK